VHKKKVQFILQIPDFSYDQYLVSNSSSNKKKNKKTIEIHWNITNKHTITHYHRLLSPPDRQDGQDSG